MLTDLLRSDFRRIETAFHNAEKSGKPCDIAEAITELERHNRAILELVMPSIAGPTIPAAIRACRLAMRKEDAYVVVLRQATEDASERSQLLVRLWHIVRDHLDNEQYGMIPFLAVNLSPDKCRELFSQIREMRQGEDFGNDALVLTSEATVAAVANSN